MKRITIIALPENNKDILADPTRNTGVHAKIEIIRKIRECAESMFARNFSLVTTKKMADSIPCSFDLDDTRARTITGFLDSLGCKWDVTNVPGMAVGQDDGPSADVTHFDLEKEIMKDDIHYLKDRIRNMQQKIFDLSRSIVGGLNNPHDDNPSMHGMSNNEINRG